MSDERESAEETEEANEAIAEEAIAEEDRFTDDELRELLTSVLLLIRSPDEATEEDRARIAGEVDSAVEAVIRRRNEIAEWAASFPTAGMTGQRHVEQEQTDARPFLVVGPGGPTPIIPTITPASSPDKEQHEQSR